MRITKIYKYEKDGVVSVGALEVPKDSTMIEEMNILEADDGMILRKKGTRDETPSVWLHDDIKQEDFEELEMEEEDDRTTDVG